jgi:hypothetical protein
MKNNNKLFIFSILFFLLTAIQLSFAEEIVLQPNHPERYVVQKGDTLWGISGTFLQKPWYWPEIWQDNPQIKNPHLIYPGDVLALVYVDGQPYVTIDSRGKRTVKLSPEARVEALDMAIPTIPLDIIHPFLTGNRVLPKNIFRTAPYIVGIAGNHMSAGADNSIYVIGIDNETKYSRYAVYKPGTIYKNPARPREALGYEAVYLGEGVVEQYGHPSIIYLQKSRAEIVIGENVLPVDTNKTFDTNFMPKSSTVSRPGNIISVMTNALDTGVNMVGAMDVVVIDIGLDDGVEVGDVFNIYQQGRVVADPHKRSNKIKLPDVKAGNMLVFRPFERVSYAIVMDTQKTLQVGDVIKSPYNQDL